MKTTMIETHLLNCGALGLRSPADLVLRQVHVVREPANYMYYCGSISPNLMLALDSVEGLEPPLGMVCRRTRRSGGGSRNLPIKS